MRFIKSAKLVYKYYEGQTGRKKLRLDILHYLLDRERTHGSILAGLDEIANYLNLSKEDALYQIDILESQGAIKSNKTFGNNVSPT